MKEILLTDGGLGSELRMRGVEVPSHVNSIWSAQALIDAPQAVEAIHIDYIYAGSDYITINNYGLTQPILRRAGLENRLKEMTISAIDLAKSAVSKTNKVNVIVCETMSSGLEAKCALEAALKTEMEVWVSWTLHGNRPNVLPSGETIHEAFLALDDLKPNAYLVNCCGANFVGQAIKELKELTNLPIGGYANAENITVISEGVNLVDDAEDLQKQSLKEINEEEYATEVAKWIDNGASIVGGCCRTRPGYIKESIIYRLSQNRS